VAVAPTDSKTVWVGTGEANGRNSSSWGDGVYKSTDGGQTWKNMGLKDSQEIGRIVIDPQDSNLVYVAVAGHLWGPSKDRGVFLTRDGGKTWEHSLAINADTGVIDLALGAPGSKIVYAAAYQRRRTPWGFSGVGPGAALYKSADAGKTWKKLTSGLPSGEMGRIGLSVCAAKPNTVYAVIENPAGGGGSLFSSNSRYGGVFRSDDAGETWKRMSGTAPRGFYFGQIRVDPTDANRVYVLGFELSVSEDGGKTFHNSSQGVHSDLHALWIDPAHPEHLLLGTDGGVYVSYDRAKTWRALNNFPMGEFYEVSTDNQTPFWVYGGLQDNGSWCSPNSDPNKPGTENADWRFISDGDGFYAFADPVDIDIVYGESQGGDIERWNRHTNQRTFLHPDAPEGQPGYRFNWNTPLALSHYDHDLLYVGGSHLFTFVKGGKEWYEISPDLSKQNGAHITSGGSGAETYGTIVCLSESPVQRGLIWCGTDDGNVQVTQDGGKTWTDVTNNLPEKVRDFWVTRLEASRYAPSRAYVAIDGHRSEDFAPYIFVTEDFGKTWHSLTGDLPRGGPVQALREDPVNPDLLFAGTEFGAYASFDRGGHWHKLSNGLPTVAVDDLTIQPRDRALVAATHGRSLYVMDDITPLEEMTPKVLASDVHLFPIPAGEEHLGGGDWFSGSAEFHGENAPESVPIVYWLRNLADEAPKITITDSAGKTVTTLTGERYPGLTTVRWDMHSGSSGPRFRGFEGPPPPGPRFVKPGTYTVTLTVGKEKQTQTVQVSGLPELSAPPEEGALDSGSRLHSKEEPQH
ncbi:MAG TPA: hypothetical protein VKT32_10770, partial [Chthonomonadaceae bacterium]|nr:hypothetical protein [Chthonomonadaceae bacterium]